MRLRLLLLLLPFFASASDQFWGPDTTRNSYCWVRGAAGSPATIVCDASSPHGLSVGDVVIIYDVLGNDIVNGIRKVTATGTTTGGSCPSGTCSTFTVSDSSGNPVNSSGTFVPPTNYGGGVVPFNWGGATAAKLYPLTDHPRIWFDGPTGTLTTALKDTGGRANPTGVQYAALTNSYNAVGVNIPSTTSMDGDNGVAAALKWFVDGQPGGAQQTNSTWYPTHLPLMWSGQMTCDETVGNCGLGQFLNSFGVNTMADLVLMVELSLPVMTSGQKTDWADFITNDNTESNAGLGMHGSVSTACTKPPTSGTFNWSAGFCGSEWMFKHASDYPLGDPAAYPTQGSFGIGLDNLALSAQHSFLMAGLSVCGLDVPGDPVADRGCRLASMTAALLWNHFIALSTGSWGRGYSNYIYNRDSVQWNYGVLLAILKNSIVGFGSFSTNLATDMSLEYVYNSIPYRMGQSLNYGADPGNLSMFADYGANGLIVPSYMAGAAGQYGLYFLINAPGSPWSAACLGSSCGIGALPSAYTFVDPNATRTNWNTLPLQRNFHARTGADCQPTGHVNCALYDIAIQQMSSRTGWGTSDTLVNVMSWWLSFDGHTDTTGSCPGCLTVCKNQCLLGGNFANAVGGNIADNSTGPNNNAVIFAGNIHEYVNLGCNEFTSPHQTRWAGDDPTGDPSNRYVYTFVDLTHALCAGTVTRASREFLHLKQGTQDYIIGHFDAAAPTPITFQEYLHYRLVQDCTGGATGICSGSGTPTAYSPGISLLRAAGVVSVSDTTTSSHIDTKILNIAGSTSIYVGDQNNSDVDCSYTGSSGASCRIEVGSSANGTSVAPLSTAEWLYVHRPSTNTADTMPAITQPACTGVGATCAVVQVADSVSPKVAVFARAGGLLTSASFTSTHSGTAQYVVAGMAPGVYSVTVNGTPVLAGATVAANDNTLPFSATSGAVQIGVAIPMITLQGVTLRGVSVR